MTRQLAFDLPARPALGRGDFLVSSANRLAVAALDGWRAWPERRFMLIGPAASGKTHLARVWAAETQARCLPGSGLAAADLPALADSRAVVIEDAEALAGTLADETALFHLHNLMAAQGVPLLITAARPAQHWGLCLPDLASRMQTLPMTQLEPPDDALLAAVLVKLFADRQLAVAPALIPYLIGRMERSFASARALVAQLDALALAEGRAVTRNLAATVLDRPEAPL